MKNINATRLFFGILLIAFSARCLAAGLFGLQIGALAEAFPDCDTTEAAAKTCLYKKSVLPFRYIELRPGRLAYLRTNFMVQIEADKLASVQVETTGLVSQDEIVRDLTAAFGNPTTLKYELKQNAFGAQFKSIVATWFDKKNAAVVLFVGADKQIDSGYIDYR